MIRVFDRSGNFSDHDADDYTVDADMTLWLHKGGEPAGVYHPAAWTKALPVGGGDDQPELEVVTGGRCAA